VRRVNRRSRWILWLALGAILAVGAAGPAQAARRSVPFGFFGTVLDPPYGDPGMVSDTALDAQMALMARSGVETLRVTFPWSSIEPAKGVYNFTYPDRIVADAARHGISLLPDLISTPVWASSQPSNAYLAGRYAPTNPQLFADFATQLVKRYGPSGTFWTSHPRLTRTYDVRQWQIWNEQGFDVFWASLPWPQSYTRLLRAAYLAIHHADQGAKVVAGSLIATGSASNQWQQATQLYRAGAKRYFDVISVHPFTDGSVSVAESINRVLIIVRNVRDVMKRNGDGRKPIILTELSWPGAVGQTRARLLGLETTPHGEVLRMTLAYNTLATHLRQTGVTQAYWYTWASSFDKSDRGSGAGYDFAGLNLITANGTFSVKPILNTYAQLAARYEGCHKGADALSCR
jgi:hypothetical protein